MSGANLDVKGESIDEERNQEESTCQEEGCSEEKEVARAGQLVRVSIHRPRVIGAVLFLVNPRDGELMKFAAAR